jgi:hypothetical protein
VTKGPGVGTGVGNVPKVDSTSAQTAYPSACESGLRVMFRWASINTSRLRPYSITLQSISPILIQMATATTTATAQAAFATIDLSSYDAEQSRLMDERCIVVDEQDRAIGALDKKTCMRKYALS